MIDLLLVNPRYHLMEEPIQENLGLGSIAAFLRARGCTVEIIDASLRNLSPRRLAREILSRRFRVLGLTVIYQGAAKEQLSVLSTLRRRGMDAHVTVGGYFPTLAHRQLIEDVPEIDSIVRGEGEYTAQELVHRLREGAPLDGLAGLTFRRPDGTIVENAPRPLIEDLDTLPFPARDEREHAFRRGGCISVIGSRGCYAVCSYCSIASFYRSAKGPAWRGRSPEHLLDEVAKLLGESPVRKVRFEDANFFGPGPAGVRRVEAIAEGILSRGLDMEFRIECRAENVDEGLFRRLREGGLREAFIGIESAVPRALESMEKGCTLEQNLHALEVLDALDIRAGVGFIAMDPETTFEEFFTNLRFVVEKVHPMKKRLGAYVDPLGRLQVFTGTRLHREMTAKGLLRGDIYEADYRFVDPSFRRFYTLFGPVQRAVYDAKGWLKRRRLARRQEF